MKIELTAKRPAGIEEAYLGRWVDGKDAGSGASLEVVNRPRKPRLSGARLRGLARPVNRMRR